VAVPAAVAAECLPEWVWAVLAAVVVVVAAVVALVAEAVVAVAVVT
jgi:hypothetical protein